MVVHGGVTRASLTSRMKSTNGILWAMAWDAAAMWREYHPDFAFFNASPISFNPILLLAIPISSSSSNKERVEALGNVIRNS